MDYPTLISDIRELLNYMDGNIDAVTDVAAPIQRQVYELLRRELMKFEITDGNLVPQQDLRKRLIHIEDEIERITGVKIWDDKITEFLSTFQTIEDRNIAMQAKHNDIKVQRSLLTPARRLIYDQAEYALTQGVKLSYVEPVKFVLMQQVTSGASITDALELLKKWDAGELSKGRYTNDMPAPNLQKYATSIARGATYGVDRTTNSIIKDRYKLNGFVYAGGLREDSRPLCEHLVGLKRPISFEELPPLLALYPQGLIAGTDVTNFIQNCGGYNCLHRAFPTRVPGVSI